MPMTLTLRCECGSLLAHGEVLPTQISKRKREFLIHYSQVSGSFYPHPRDNLIVCTACYKPAMHHGTEGMEDKDIQEPQAT